LKDLILSFIPLLSFPPSLISLNGVWNEMIQREGIKDHPSSPLLQDGMDESVVFIEGMG